MTNRERGRVTFIVSIVLLLILAASTSPASAIVMAGHELSSQCPGGSPHENCLARAQYFPPSDYGIRGITAWIVGSPGAPCVMSQCDNEVGCGTFTAAPLWIPKTRNGHGNDDVVPEIGIMRFDSSDGGTKWYVYVYCGHCDGVPNEIQLFDENPGPGTGLQIWYEPSNDEWVWLVIKNGVSKRLRTYASIGMGMGGRADAGGESTNWAHDMGVTRYGLPQTVIAPVNNASSWSWDKFPQRGLVGFYPPGDAQHGGRYLNSTIASGLWVMSDHHYSHHEDACGNTP